MRVTKRKTERDNNSGTDSEVTGLNRVKVSDKDIDGFH